LSLVLPSSPSVASYGVATLATALGATLVLVFSARATRSAVLGARLVGVEVERQLRELPKQPGLAALPADFTPSYKGCVEAALEAARGASVAELASLLFAPFLLGLLLRGSGAASFSVPLVGFGVAAVLGSLILSSVGRTTRSVLAELRRRLRGSEAGFGPAAATQAESFGELVGVTAASSVEAFAFALALTVLCLAPLLR
jgi:Na+/H+-translocating membrane pyrophosphatase